MTQSRTAIRMGALVGAALWAVGCTGGDAGQGPDSGAPDSAQQDAAPAPDGAASPDGGATALPVRITARAVARCGTWAPDHQSGLRYQTPSHIVLGVQSVALMRSHLDLEPVALPLPEDIVEVDASGDGRMLDLPAASLPAGTYTHVRVGLAYARYDVAATAHQMGMSAAGTLSVDLALSDHVSGEGQPRAQGAYRATFTAFGQSYGYSGTTPLNCTLSRWGGIAATTGTRFEVRVPLPGGPIRIAPDRTDPVHVALDFPMEDAFAWRDLAEPSFADGVLDIAQPPQPSELPDTLVECNLLMADRCIDQQVVPFEPSWPMPDSRVLFCTDGTDTAPCPSPGEPGYGQDAQYDVNPMRYAVTADTVRDEVTGLTWQRAVAPGSYDWWEARDYCAALDLGGHTDWRLPSRTELVSLVDFGALDPTIDLEAFPETPSDFFWSGSPVPFLNLAYGVRFELGFIYDHDPYGTGRVRCVRGAPPPPSPRFSTTAEVVTDHATGLMWQRGHLAARGWLEALATCEALDLGGFDDWRLPTVKELQTLVDDRRLQPAIDVVAFPDTPPEWFWSATPIQVPPSQGWATSYTDGYASIHAFTELHLVRCVRDP